MKHWINNHFESSSSTTEEFKAFSRDFNKYLIKKLGNEYKIVDFSRGHFYVSGFIQDKAGKYYYFSVSDVRYFPNEWYDHVLIRTAEHAKDYTGGRNTYCKLDEIAERLKTL